MSLPSNYRPISLLITISKLLEKVIYKRTYGFLEKENAIYKSQYGFRSKHSCKQAVCELLSEIIKNNDKDQITMTVYLDLSKAFDTLDHKLLLNKMERYGIRGIALSWFKSYLTARTLKSKVNTNDGIMYSKPYDIEYGNPQGSCLGPLLFLLFTNDLHLHLLYSNCILFADDTTIFYSGKSIRYIEWCIQEDLKILQDWFQANKLTLNLNKAVVMIFGTKIPKNYKIEIDNHTLPVVTATKFLGTWIDSELNWKVHYDKLVVKLLQNMHMLRLCKNQFNIFTKRNIYFAHIYSHLSYGLHYVG